MLQLRYTGCHYAGYHYAGCHYAGCHYAGCHYAGCHYTGYHKESFSLQVSRFHLVYDDIQRQRNKLPGTNVIKLFTAVIYKFSK
jgi:hypothetical protein